MQNREQDLGSAGKMGLWIEGTSWNISWVLFLNMLKHTKKQAFGCSCQMICVNYEPFLKGIPVYSCIPTVHPACVCEQRSCTYFANAKINASIPNWSRFSVIAQLESIWMGIEYPSSSQFQPNPNWAVSKTHGLKFYCLIKGFTTVYYSNLLKRGSANNPANSKHFTNFSQNQVPTSVKII